MIRGTARISGKRAEKTAYRKRHVRDRLHPHRRGARGASGDNARAQGRGAEVRRADALVAPGDGKSVRQVCRFLYLDPDTVRGWPRGFGGTGLASVDPAAYPEREGKLTRAREASLRATLRESPPRDTNGVRDIILRLHGVEYTRGGAIKLMHRPGFGYVKPKPLPRQADRAAREVFMRKYERAVREAPPDEAIVFADAVHPEWQSRPAHGRVLRSDRPAVRSTTGRRRPDPHGAPDPGTVEPATGGGGRIDATTTLRLLRRLECARPGGAAVHVLPGNARHRHAKAPNPSWSGRDAASGRASRRPTRRTRPRRAPVGGHAPPREA